MKRFWFNITAALEILHEAIWYEQTEALFVISAGSGIASSELYYNSVKSKVYNPKGHKLIVCDGVFGIRQESIGNVHRNNGADGLHR